jgi:hypothetical protein
MNLIKLYTSILYRFMSKYTGMLTMFLLSFFNRVLICFFVLLLSGEKIGENNEAQMNWIRGTRESGLGANNSVRPTRRDRFDY